MVTSGELTENLEPNTAPITDGNYMNNHCVYLEQLLGKLRYFYIKSRIDVIYKKL